MNVFPTASLPIASVAQSVLTAKRKTSEQAWEPAAIKLRVGHCGATSAGRQQHTWRILSAAIVADATVVNADWELKTGTGRCS